MSPEPLAHISQDGRTHTLREHLYRTAERAADFAAVFGFRQWGYLNGLWHDVGKYALAFQKKLKAAASEDGHLEGKARVDHSTAGAIFAVEHFKMAGRLFAYISAGHHAGLPDWTADRTGQAALSHRLLNKDLLNAALEGGIPDEILEQSFPEEKPTGFDPAFWIRILFSCVVDADFLDTEEFFEPEKTSLRSGYPALSQLMDSFGRYMIHKQATAPDTPVNRIRAQVFARCIEKAKDSPGIFSLTVPTGGGKTLSSMAFALNHAAMHGQRRIIYVIPYTSIIEQTANQFREIFGEAVVEHHSNIDVSDAEGQTSKARLACENWDAPLIVTTNVQFFESLFASRTSRCRKLHNIAGSVVVLDEAQLFPPEFLRPILKALDELRKHYGVTVLICTATQPALGPHKSSSFTFEGLENIREIMEDPTALYDHLRRVEVQLPENIYEAGTWEGLAEELAKLPSVLCIVNRRDDCRLLWSLMPEGTFHLSALMCGAHRSDTIARIKMRLYSGLPTCVISTQLVEAGVDLDFPAVYRAIAGLDSIAQAAGRCNREGLLEKGKLTVFIPPTRPPAGILRQAAEIGARLLGEKVPDHLAPTRLTAFFRELYWLQGEERLDAKNILRDLKPDGKLRFSFRSAAANFKLINDAASSPVLVSYGEAGVKLLELLKYMGPERWLLRKLQRYVVNLPKPLHQRLLAEGAIREIHPGIYVQGHGTLYNGDLGFCPEKSIIYDPDELIG
ncbi:CRISPR-associated helicase Cas3' [Desulforhabdus sp. TSK]|uniref:CRISPR-associated helicase Cas3' n=1 Tax=Desulforhabdus sp. TSK TaxID=2925014 RepID=UPI001FC8DC41|nr:CRISPR-associated helicase Cas3' [Desulforhabdus sp. TSK]GKT08811.1 CRISPR-associated helicase Cas3 [Desulforhabdus sp. TSK]